MNQLTRTLRPALAVTIAALTCLLATALFASEADRLAGARAFLDENRVHRGTFKRPENFDSMHRQIAATRDPETKFGPYIFALARKGDKVLSAEQSTKVNALIAARGEAPVNWHDVRNIVRMQAVMTLWAFAIEEQPARAEILNAEWNAWTDLRLAYMFQEFVAKERFQRAMWEIYTPEQRESIRSGAWEHLIKKNTGHGRLFSADKQVRRAFGDPDDPAAFDEIAKGWRARWDGILARYQEAALFQRQREFAMDEAGESFAIASWSEYRAAFRAFAGAEQTAIRELVQAGYEVDDELRQKATGLQEGLEKQTREKYSEHGADLLRRLAE